MHQLNDLLVELEHIRVETKESRPDIFRPDKGSGRLSYPELS